MGSMQALGYAEAVADGTVRLEVALVAHLQSNWYPPLPVGYVKPLVTALAHASVGDWMETVPLPDGLNPLPATAWEEDGHYFVRTDDLVQITKTWAFVDHSDDDYEDVAE